MDSAIVFRQKRHTAILALLIILAMVPFSANILGVSRLQLSDLLIPLLFGFSLIDAVAITRFIHIGIRA